MSSQTYSPSVPSTKMATSFFLWSSSQNKGEDGGGRGEDGSPSPATAKPKIRKGGAGAKASAPKRPPQRGLGVAQLEQLRVQERFNKITELDSSARGVAPLHFPHISPAPAVPPMYGAPLAYSVGHHLDCYLHRFRPMVPGQAAFVGTAPGSATRSVLGDHYATDSYWRTAAAAAAAGDARFLVGNPFPEPPSNQITQCLSDQCEFCVRKKRLFGNSQSANLSHGADYFEMDLAASMAVNMDCGCHQTKLQSAVDKERHVFKEFDFFPPGNLSSSYCGGSAMLTDQTVDVEDEEDVVGSASKQPCRSVRMVSGVSCMKLQLEFKNLSLLMKRY